MGRGCSRIPGPPPFTFSTSYTRTMSLNQDVADLLREKYGKKNPAPVQPGDTVRVHQRIVEINEKGERKERTQIFEGLVIATKHGKGLDGSFTVRKIAAGSIGVERTYPVHSPNVVKVERTKTASVSRAKLYYMRDRLGKAARFRNETRTPMSWDETVPVAVEEVPELAPVQVSPEGTLEADMLKQLAATPVETTPTESEEVTAAVEGEALKQEQKK